MTVNRQPILMGAIAVAVGLSVGYLMLEHPEGLNPSWPIEAALVVPAAFVLAGVHMISFGLGSWRLAAASLQGVVLCLLAIANWAAFFSAHVHCVESISFFGVALLRRLPSEAECQARLRGLIAAMDAVIAAVALLSMWRGRRRRSL